MLLESDSAGIVLSITSVDAKHRGASLGEWWNVTWVGNNSMYTLNHNSPKFVCNAIVLCLVCRYASMDDSVVELCQMRCFVKQLFRQLSIDLSHHVCSVSSQVCLHTDLQPLYSRRSHSSYSSQASLLTVFTYCVHTAHAGEYFTERKCYLKAICSVWLH